jgi:hypothetical protein
MTPGTAARTSPGQAKGKAADRRVARAGAAAALIAILALALHLDLRNNDFALGLHADEERKARAVQTAMPEFLHPHVLYHATRALADLTRAASLQEIARAGRTASALFGAGVVLASFFLYRRRLPAATALAACALLAATPLLVVHAHYLKEDAAFACATTLALLALGAAVRAPDRGSFLVLGLATGLAVSSKYAGVLLLPVYLLVPKVVPVGDPRSWRHRIGVVAMVALAVFLLCNPAILARPGRFLTGVRMETQHVLRGHEIAVWAPACLFVFHILHSILPGLTLAVTVPALAGILLTAWRWRTGRVEGRAATDEAGAIPAGAGAVPAEDRLWLLFLGLYYACIELSPTKPFPDFMRYTLPLAPILVYFAARLVEDLAARRIRRPGLVAVPVLLALAAWPLGVSLRLVEHLDGDTRLAAASRVADLQGPVLLDRGAVVWPPGTNPAAPTVDLWDGVPDDFAAARYAVTSSFRYDRFLLSDHLPFQSTRTRRIAALYRELFACPHEEIRPAYRTFAFSNPTIRIVDLAGCARPSGGQTDPDPTARGGP